MPKKYPHKPAVVSWDGELSYGQVEQLSNTLAIKLIHLGATIGTIISLCFDKSIWTIVGVLAVLKAGGSLALTDPSQPEARLQAIAKDVSTTFILTSDGHAELGFRVILSETVVTVGPPQKLHYTFNLHQAVLASQRALLFLIEATFHFIKRHRLVDRWFNLVHIRNWLHHDNN